MARIGTSFTIDQLQQLEEEFQLCLPPEPTLDDVAEAPTVKRLAFAGTEWGMLLHVDTGKAGKKNLFLNPLVARTLMEGIGEGGKVQNWWPKVENKQIPLAPELTPDDLDTAEQVRSVRTANVPTGLLAVFGSERGHITCFLTPNFAAAVAWSVSEIGLKAGWWGEDFDIRPAGTDLN